jgi:para-aminobenzoate synthetase component 1
MSKSDEAIQQMNGLGAARTPFLFIIDFDMNEPMVVPLADAEANGLLYNIHGTANVSSNPTPPPRFAFRKHPVPLEEYRRAFNEVREHLHRGNSYLLNLTFPTRLDTTLTLEEIFRLSTAPYKLLCHDRFVVFSPETFVQVQDGIISSCPMKGTIDAHLDDAESRILNDPKELAEHTTIVDLIRNDLSMVAKQVRVEQFRYIDRVRTNEKHLLQVSSRITGRLPDDWHRRVGEIMFTLLPAGSVTGAPKKKTVEIIRSVEIYERGYYTGVMGMFDGNMLDSAVMIRFIEKIAGGLVYKSGGGITVFSDVESEYQELIDKVYVPIV